MFQTRSHKGRVLLRSSAESRTYCGSIAAGRPRKNVHPTTGIIESSIPPGRHILRFFDNAHRLKFRSVNISLPIENIGVPWRWDVVLNGQSLLKNEPRPNPHVTPNWFTPGTCHVLGAVRDALGMRHPTDQKDRSAPITGGSERSVLYRVVGAEIRVINCKPADLIFRNCHSAEELCVDLGDTTHKSRGDCGDKTLVSV